MDDEPERLEEKSKQDAYVFVDLGFMSAISRYYQQYKHVNIDYEKFFDNLCEIKGYKRVETYIFTAKKTEKNFLLEITNKYDVKKHLEELKRVNDETDLLNYENELREKAKRKFQGKERFIARLNRIKDTRVNEDGRLQWIGTYLKQKGVDVRLAVEMTRLALRGNIKNFILVSSDSDFVPVVKMVKDEEVHVTLAYPKKNISGVGKSSQLELAVNDWIDISEHFINQNLF